MDFLKRIDSCFLVYFAINIVVILTKLFDVNGKEKIGEKIEFILMFMLVSSIYIIFCKIFKYIKKDEK